MATRKSASKKSAKKGSTKKSAKKAGAKLPPPPPPPPPPSSCINSCLTAYRRCIASGTNSIICQVRLVRCTLRCVGVKSADIGKVLKQ